MKITGEELAARGFERKGSVYPDAADTLRLEMTGDLDGFVVYLMIVDGEVMKAGKTEHRLSRRMTEVFGSLRRKMGEWANHHRYQETTFKHHASATILRKQTVQIWARQVDSQATMISLRDELNDLYEGLWTKQGERQSGGGNT